MKKIFIFTFVVANAFLVKSQTIFQNSIWFRAYFRVKWSEKWSFHSEFDERRLTNADKQLQFITHQHLHYRFGRYTEGVIGGSFSAVRQGNLDVPEWRLFQEFHTFWESPKHWRLSHRLRTEQRFFHNYAKNELLAGFNYHFRIRFRPQIDYKMPKNWTLKLGNEIMYQDEKFEQNRIYCNIEKRFLSQKLAVEVGFIKLLQARNSGGYFDRNIARATILKDF